MRNYLTRTNIVIPIVRIVVVEVHLAVRRIPIAVRRVAVGQPHLALSLVLVTENLLGFSACTWGIPCIV